MKSGWVDDEGKVFIYYTVENIMEAMTCGNKKAGTLLAELDDKRGIGLISRVRQGLGKPDRIYVHKCVTPEMSKGHVQTCQIDISGDVFRHLKICQKDTLIILIQAIKILNSVRLILSLRASRCRYAADQGMVTGGWMNSKAYRAYFLESCSFEVLKTD